jgi:hypothetical protein
VKSLRRNGLQLNTLLSFGYAPATVGEHEFPTRFSTELIGVASPHYQESLCHLRIAKRSYS